MSDALSPRLTKLDEAILGHLPSAGAGVRFEVIYGLERKRRSTRYGPQEEPDLLELREILLGLQHLGLAECRNGWWRRP